MYKVLVCKEGMIAVERNRALPLLERARAGDGLVTKADGHLIPCCRSEDVVLAQPPLAISLEWIELQELIGEGTGWPVTATCFGPPQDKSRNEDAALSAVISGAGTQKFIFAAVADGVSTRTFWSERTSRLACLAAFKELRTMVLGGDLDLAAAAQDLRIRLQASIRKTLIVDRADIIRSNATPPDWAPDLYTKYIHREEFWYNSTLLMCCLGPTSGVAVWAGDGGLKIVKKGREGENAINAITPVKSTDDSEIHEYVSLSRDINLSCGAINYSNTSEIDVFLASDGVDRTLQRDISNEYETLRLESGTAARKCLEELWLGAGAEIDNYSVARIRWPFPVVTGASRAEASAMELSGKDASSVLPDPTVAGGIVPTAPPTKTSVSPPPPSSNLPTATHSLNRSRPNKVGTITKSPKDTSKKNEPNTFHAILDFLEQTKGLEQTYNCISAFSSSKEVAEAAYRLWSIVMFFTDKILDKIILLKLQGTKLGNFLQAPPHRLDEIIQLVQEIKDNDAYKHNFIAKLKHSPRAKEMCIEESRKNSFRVLLNFIDSVDLPPSS